MASLHKLLSQEGFQRTRKKNKFKDQGESSPLSIYVCLDSSSVDSSSLPRAEEPLSLKGSSRRGGGSSSGSQRSNEKSVAERNPSRDETTIGDDDIKALVSILTGYVGRYLRDKNFRLNVREKCTSSFERRKKKHSDNEILAQMELCIHSIERLVENPGKEMDSESLEHLIKQLNAVASLDYRTPKSTLSACAHLYLSIINKILKNDTISAKYLLHVFIDSPFLARTQLLPQLWVHFFLPHLLHLKIWYNKELDFLASSEYADKEKKIKALNEKYNDRMDSGTAQFALYYKEWLKVGAQAPSVPSVPLPSKSSYPRSRTRRKSSDTSASYHSFSNKLLYQAVFGPIAKTGEDSAAGAWENAGLEEEAAIKHCSYVEKKAMVAHRCSWSQGNGIQKDELWPVSQKTDSFRLLASRALPTEYMGRGRYVSNNEKIKHDEQIHLHDMSRAIATICSSDSLYECEMAIREVSEAWLNSSGEMAMEASLSRPSVIQGVMEILYVSNDNEILELALSILAELADKSDMNRLHILNSDPHLDVFIRLLRSNSLFLKAAALMYLVKPKANHMTSIEWISLFLRVLELGDQLQTLFTVRCSPHMAAYHFLLKLLTGFDRDKNLENARQIILLGRLSLLVRRMEVGDTIEKGKAVAVLCYCIQADESCRYLLAKNLKKEAIISLLVLGKESDSRERALALLSELLCLSWGSQRIESLTGLAEGWDCLNTKHILLSYLQRAPPAERPIIAVMLLQLDLMGNPMEVSVYREEALDAIVKALDCRDLDKKVQEQSARALLILGGRFSYTGGPEVERWLLKKAGLYEETKKSLCGEDATIDGHLDLNEEDKTTENWQRKATLALLTSGDRRLLAALSNSIANGIPCLARASLVTVCWVSSSLDHLGDNDLIKYAARSILIPRLTECFNDGTTPEEKILASYSLHSLTKGTTDNFSRGGRGSELPSQTLPSDLDC